MNNHEQDQLQTQDDCIRYLDQKNTSIFAFSDEFISAKIDGKTFDRITLSRAMPFSDPDSYLIVKDNEDKELGIIRSITDFDLSTQELLQKHLALRYYCPKITQITEVKDKFGFIYVTVETDSGQKNFASSDLTKSIKRIKGDRYIIVDVEGNRFLIEDLNQVKNYKKIIAYII